MNQASATNSFYHRGFSTPDAFHQPQEAIISSNKLGLIHINMLHTLSQNIFVKLYIFKILKCMIKETFIYTLLKKNGTQFKTT
jgi:hypothetical protein